MSSGQGWAVAVARIVRFRIPMRRYVFYMGQTNMASEEVSIRLCQSDYSGKSVSWKDLVYLRVNPAEQAVHWKGFSFVSRTVSSLQQPNRERSHGVFHAAVNAPFDRRPWYRNYTEMLFHPSDCSSHRHLVLRLSFVMLDCRGRVWSVSLEAWYRMTTEQLIRASYHRQVIVDSRECHQYCLDIRSTPRMSQAMQTNDWLLLLRL